MDLHFTNRGNGYSLSEIVSRMSLEITGTFEKTGKPFSATPASAHLIGVDSTRAEWCIIADAPSGRAHIANIPLSFTIADIAKMNPIFSLVKWDSQKIVLGCE